MRHETTLIRDRVRKPIEAHYGRDIWMEKVPGTPFNKGLPDSVACIKGAFAGIESKKEDNVYSLIQITKLRRIARAGGVALGVMFMKDGSITVSNWTYPSSVSTLTLAMHLCSLIRADRIIEEV